MLGDYTASVAMGINKDGKEILIGIRIDSTGTLRCVRFC